MPQRNLTSSTGEGVYVPWGGWELEGGGWDGGRRVAEAVKRGVGGLRKVALRAAGNSQLPTAVLSSDDEGPLG